MFTIQASYLDVKNTGYGTGQKGRWVAGAAIGTALLCLMSYGSYILYRKLSCKHPFAGQVRGSDELKQTYDFKVVLSELDSLTDKKICLFIGRNVDETLPEEEGKVWISADNVLNEAIPEGRIHLWLDFSDSNQLTDLQGRFDEIVIDHCVTKFLNGNFVDRFIPLLKRGSETLFVFEPIPDGIGLSSQINDADYYFSGSMVPTKWWTNKEIRAQVKNLMVAYVKEHASQYFTEVKHYAGREYYYPRPKDTTRDYVYIVAKGLK